MPNHFHFVIEPSDERALSRFMQWLLTSHVRRYHRHYGGSGHVWQGRFKSFPIQRDEHLVTVLRYVLQNPVRAGLCGSAREWGWSSLQRPQLSDRWPIDDGQWFAGLDEPLNEQQLSVVRESVNRQKPLGKPDWQSEIASRLGLVSTLRPRGRPQKK
jgi:putative transposase